MFGWSGLDPSARASVASSEANATPPRVVGSLIGTPPSFGRRVEAGLVVHPPARPVASRVSPPVDAEFQDFFFAAGEFEYESDGQFFRTNARSSSTTAAYSGAAARLRYSCGSASWSY